MSMTEVGRLTAQLARSCAPRPLARHADPPPPPPPPPHPRSLAEQKSRTDELRDTHRLETASQSSTIDALRAELASTTSSLALATDSLTESQSALSTAAADYAKLQIVAKEEEEKRIKALSLLRALRQKLVKAEKDKEDLALELAALKSAETTDRARFESEIVSLRAAQELQLSKLDRKSVV